MASASGMAAKLRCREGAGLTATDAVARLGSANIGLRDVESSGPVVVPASALHHTKTSERRGLLELVSFNSKNYATALLIYPIGIHIQ